MLLAAFGALQVVEFLSSPLGVALVDIGSMGWVVALAAAFALGFGVLIWPQFMIAVASIAVVAGSLFGTTAGNATCRSGADVSALGPTAGFVILFLLARVGMKRPRA
ncbi:MAG: hypothetical protein DI573_02880 [Microbacterium sp.]|uniref:hypothetical protein n=1 Tax=Microbacterium sp. TaxID=51671 RepID=UPI000DB339FF|nr:hypothetical protein [Microbacterium sp.]PZU40787.1 MAG: hypothetical protein DI573_02880 [Microbacterium sp.]